MSRCPTALVLIGSRGLAGGIDSLARSLASPCRSTKGPTGVVAADICRLDRRARRLSRMRWTQRDYVWEAAPIGGVEVIQTSAILSACLMFRSKHTHDNHPGPLGRACHSEEGGGRWSNHHTTLTRRGRRLEGGDVAAHKAAKALKLVREVASSEVGREARDVEDTVGQLEFGVVWGR